MNTKPSFADAPDRVRVKGPSRIRFDESARFTCLATPSRPAPDLKWRVGVEGQVRACVGEIRMFMKLDGFGGVFQSSF